LAGGPLKRAVRLSGAVGWEHTAVR